MGVKEVDALLAQAEALDKAAKPGPPLAASALTALPPRRGSFAPGAVGPRTTSPGRGTRCRWDGVRSIAWGLLLFACAAAPLPAAQSIIDQLKEKDVAATSSRYNFSGSTDIRFSDGGHDVTPFNFNNQDDTGGVSTFTALRMHLFLDATLSERTTIFVKVGGGALDQARLTLDALAITTKLGDGWPNLEVGRFLSPFGKFSQRFLGPDNPLIGEPLIYTYATSLSTSQVPANAVDLLSQRGRGTRSQFLGYPAQVRGQSLQSNVWYLNGAKLGGVADKLSYAVAVTNDAISASELFDSNDNKAVTMHLGYKPDIAWQIGCSASTSAYLNRRIHDNPVALGVKLGDFVQDSLGVDLDYASGPFSLFAEYIHNGWRTPFVGEDLKTHGFFIEPRFKVAPGISLVARYDALWFSDLTIGGIATPWEFDVSRLELGVDYNIERDLLVKASYQFNRTDSPAGDPDDNLVQLQLVGVF